MAHHPGMTNGPLLPMLQLGVLAAALMLAGLATLLQRRPEPVPDWPPSPPPVKDVRRDLIVTSASLLFLVAGVAVAVLAIATTVISLLVDQRPGIG